MYTVYTYKTYKCWFWPTLYTSHVCICNVYSASNVLHVRECTQFVYLGAHKQCVRYMKICTSVHASIVSTCA